MVINGGVPLPPQILLLIEHMISISVVGQGFNQVYLLFHPNKTSMDRGQNAAVQEHTNMASNTTAYPLGNV